MPCVGERRRRGWKGNEWRLILQGLGSVDFAPNVMERQEATQEWTRPSALKSKCTYLCMCVHTHAYNTHMF